MTIELRFPVEFLVSGTPVSSQAKRREAVQEWQTRIRGASQTALPEGHFATEIPVAVTLYYFPAAAMQGDIDNIVKPILNALSRHLYVDDHQVQRLLVQKFEPNNIFAFASPSRVLSYALERMKPILYVRISDDPFEELA